MIQKVKFFFVGSFDELKKVIWPSRREVISHTTIVILSALVAMAIIAAIDFGLFNLVQLLIERK